LLRLLAATQVAFFHCANHLGIALNSGHPLVVLAAAFAGVPIFFVISGFLISLSFERNSDTKAYFCNRALRIYPALWTCLLVSLMAAMVLGHIDFVRPEAIPWVLGQLTIIQFYHPQFLRSYGVGVLNGSLWTIPVELEFYVVVPLIYFVLRLRSRPGNAELALLGLASIGAQYAYLHFGGPDSAVFLVKLFGVSVAPYFWMFLIGVAIQRNFGWLGPFLVGHGGVWLAGYATIVSISMSLGIRTGTNTPNPVVMIVLALAVVACAYTKPGLAARLLRDNDVSYGVYIYHAVFLNASIAIGMRTGLATLGAILATTYVVAWVSWKVIEHPALRKKRNPLHVLFDPAQHDLSATHKPSTASVVSTACRRASNIGDRPFTS
jgi:peptidoglycan/LPS O-acetylase OafA/YrhL